MKHILLYSDDPGEGGLAQYEHSLVCQLKNLGYQVSNAHGKPLNEKIEREQELGIQQINLGFTSGQDFTRTLKDLGSAENIFREAKPDLIVFSDGWPFSTFAAKQAAIQLGIPYAIVLGFINAECANFSYGDGVDYTDAVSHHYSQAKALVAVSQENADLIHQIYRIPQSKIQIIHYGRPAKYFEPPDPSIRGKLRQQLGLPDGAIACLTSARLAPVKGHQYLLEAIQQLKQTEVWEKLYFLWAGTGTGDRYSNIESQLKESVRKLGVTERVKFLGQRSDIPDLLTASDIFVFPSKAEGMPLSVMEAMAKGLPVIASSVSGIPEELGDTGKLLPDPNRDPEGTVRELVNTLQAWAGDNQLRASVGQACHQRAAKMFKEERMLAEHIAMIEQALSGEDSTKGENETDLLDPSWIQELAKRIAYGSIVWNAWRLQHQGDLSGMSKLLKTSIKDIPFSRTEAVLNWIESFAKFSLEKGEKLDTYYLTTSVEWQNLICSVQQEKILK
ncbi:glycosyltransferase family 4 protein [Leptolyngbya sp. FACHB-671]|uniref:glycosyltransferase n=1 Tax=Leptolyngbya sp. FACHB-671 TaxID=2692812 RepID=UPI001685F810|nr:glycosyltransferase [Leptolyngbya sp. FACHB-671]MBD2071196.1 glycosyltransferase family 4 protein [Leptolyngbya sp. FACHB-671]